MNFSGISDKCFPGRLLRSLLKVLPHGTAVPVLQGKLRGYKWIVGSSNHGCWLGSYEYNKQKLFSNTIQPGSVVFDIGANVGFYTLLASELVGPSGCVVALEPWPANVKLLRRHVDMNHCANVTILDCAVGGADGTARFAEGPNNSQGHLSAAGALEIKLVTLDLLVLQKQIPAPDYLKIDIEGAEFEALKGAIDTLAQFHPVIFLATHGSEVHVACCDLLTSLDYQLSPVTGNRVEDASELLAVPVSTRPSSPS